MANNRLYYAITQLGIKGDGQASYRAIHGAQSAGMTTNFPIENINELGQLNPYENVEDIPTVDLTISKVLDGYPLIWHEATIDATSPTLAGRSTAKSLLALAYFAETLDFATGTPSSEVEISGAFPTSLRYTFPLQGNMTEEVGLQANQKVWANDPKILQSSPWDGAFTLDFDGVFDGNDGPIGSGGVNRRENLIFQYNGALPLDAIGMVADPDATILPPEIWGISSSGTNEKTAGVYAAHIGDITVSATLNREDLFEQGSLAPYAKTLTFPIEVTAEINTTAVSGDMVSATNAGIYSTGSTQCSSGGNLRGRVIRIATCEGTRIYLGNKCKLSSVNQTGGDATGGNVTVSYSFLCYNTFTVLHSGDPNAQGATWWNSRSTYLVQ